MKKWNEIAYKTAIGIIKDFIKKEEWTLDKILEIQDPIGIITNTPHRVYLGNYINSIEELKKFNNPFLETIKRLQIWGVEEKKEHACVIMIRENKIPIILPLFKDLEQVDLVLLGYKDTPVIKCWKRVEGKRIFNPKKYPTNTEDLYVRIRIINKKTWKNIILGDQPIEMKEDDLKKEDFTLQ